MSKAARLIELMLAINTKKRFTVGELAEEFSVSKRTILRDLKDLEVAGLPLHSEVGASGGYRVLKNRMLPPVSLSECETTSMFFACQSLYYYRDLPFGEETVSALSKYFRCLPEDVKENILELQRRIIFWIPKRHRDAPLLKTVLDAAVERKVLTVQYRSPGGERVHKVLPIGLYAMNGLWYCPSYCFYSRKVIELRIDCIHEIQQSEYWEEQGRRRMKLWKQKALERVQGLPATIQDYLDRFEPETGCEIEARLTTVGVVRCESELLLARGLRVDEDGTGVVAMKIPKHSVDWAAGFFLSCGTEVEVIGSKDLLDRINARLKELNNQYGKSNM